MTNKNFHLSDSDIQTLVMTLSILPTLGLEDSDIQAKINMQCCLSAVEHLATLDSYKPTPNEVRIMYASLQAAQLINKGRLKADSEVKAKCSNAMFSINKLLPHFESYIKQLS